MAHADLSELDPAERLPVLLAEWSAETITLDYEEVRLLFIFAWADGTAASPDHDHEVLQMLRWISPVRDSEEHLFGTVTIYRAADGDERSIRWTLDQDAARGGWGSNGILRATVKGHHVRAHLSAGGINQVLVDPDDLENVETI